MKNPYKKILVAVDMNGSPEIVLKRASEFAEDGVAEFYVLSLIQIAVPDYPVISPIDASIPKDMSEHIGSLIEEKVANLKVITDDCDVSANEVAVEFGRAADSILDKADAIQADLIIMGSHGRHGWNILLGSTANAVLHKAKCDVLAVRIKE